MEALTSTHRSKVLHYFFTHALLPGKSGASPEAERGEMGIREASQRLLEGFEPGGK